MLVNGGKGVMTMRKLGLCMLAMLATSGAAHAQSRGDVGAPPMSPGDARRAMMVNPQSLPPQLQGEPRRGYESYRQPYYGFTLPREWMAPGYYISDYDSYDLDRPASGYGWSRYYDDAVLTDRYGRVYDWRDNVDWSGGYGDDDRQRYDRRSSGVGGAIAGAVVGGIAGNVIAGRGDRLAGTLIGGGVGALAGGAIDRAQDRRGPRYGRGHDRYRGVDHGRSMHWHGQGHYAAPVIGYDHSYGCGGCGTTVTVVTTTHAAPVTRTITYETEQVRQPIRRKYVPRVGKDRRL